MIEIRQHHHESLPGYQLQGALALEGAETSLLHRSQGFNAYGEGWGLYAVARERTGYRFDLKSFRFAVFDGGAMPVLAHDLTRPASRGRP